MKRLILFALCFLSQTAFVQALDVQGRAAYFYPAESRVRDIYSSKGFAEYELEISNPIDPSGCKYTNWDYFLNLSYYHKKGHSSGCGSYGSSTEMTNWALNIGAKRYFDLNCFSEKIRPYLGAGAGFAHVSFHDKSEFVKRHKHEFGGSLLFKSGIKYELTCNLFTDLFLDYSYHWFRFDECNKACVKNRNPNTGGLKVGLGLGYQF